MSSKTGHLSLNWIFFSSLRCANRSRASTKLNNDRAVSKLETSKRVISDLFEEKKKITKHSDEASNKAKSLQSQLHETINSKILPEKLDVIEFAKKHLEKSLNKKSNQLKEHSKIDKLVKQLKVIRVETDNQRAESIQLS